MRVRARWHIGVLNELVDVVVHPRRLDSHHQSLVYVCRLCAKAWAKADVFVDDVQQFPYDLVDAMCGVCGTGQLSELTANGWTWLPLPEDVPAAMFADEVHYHLRADQTPVHLQNINAVRNCCHHWTHSE